MRDSDSTALQKALFAHQTDTIFQESSANALQTDTFPPGNPIPLHRYTCNFLGGHMLQHKTYFQKAPLPLHRTHAFSSSLFVSYRTDINFPGSFIDCQTHFPGGPMS